MVYSIPFSHISALIILFQCDWLQSFRGFTFLFTVIAAVVLFIAASRSNNTATSPVSPTADTREMVDEKNADVKV